MLVVDDGAEADEIIDLSEQLDVADAMFCRHRQEPFERNELSAARGTHWCDKTAELRNDVQVPYGIELPALKRA